MGRDRSSCRTPKAEQSSRIRIGPLWGCSRTGLYYSEAYSEILTIFWCLQQPHSQLKRKACGATCAPCLPRGSSRNFKEVAVDLWQVRAKAMAECSSSLLYAFWGTVNTSRRPSSIAVLTKRNPTNGSPFPAPNSLRSCSLKSNTSPRVCLHPRAFDRLPPPPTFG